MASSSLRSRSSAAGMVFVLLGLAVPLGAQSLADVARKEEERRKELNVPAKVYTNKDLASVPAPSTAPSTDAAQPVKDAGKDAAGAKEAAKANDKDKADEPKKDQAYWSGRMKELQAQLDRDQMFADSLQTRINALTTDFVNRDDPAQRAVIERDRQKAVAELDRVKKQVIADKKAVEDFQEEARRAAVPPGWLR